KDAHFWRTFDALQPDPLYEDFICVESGGLAIDAPNGKYHVFVNMDSPSAYWGEFQVYRRRALILNGERHEDRMDFESFKRRYFDFVRQRRRWHFDNAFKRVLPPPTGEAPKPTDAERERGFIAFHRDFMKDVNVGDRPLAAERVEELTASAFAGEYAPVTASV